MSEDEKQNAAMCAELAVKLFPTDAVKVRAILSSQGRDRGYRADVYTPAPAAIGSTAAAAHSAMASETVHLSAFDVTPARAYTALAVKLRAELQRAKR